VSSTKGVHISNLANCTIQRDFEGCADIYPEVVRVKRRQNNPTCLIEMLMVPKKIKGTTLGNAENFQIWRAVLTND
jgi:hypothetical protein